MSSHTPGPKNNPFPWSVKDEVRIAGTHHELMVVNRNGGLVATVTSIGGDREDHEFCARLIAAAPDRDWETG